VVLPLLRTFSNLSFDGRYSHLGNMYIDSQRVATSAARGDISLQFEPMRSDFYFHTLSSGGLKQNIILFISHAWRVELVDRRHHLPARTHM